MPRQNGKIDASSTDPRAAWIAFAVCALALAGWLAFAASPAPMTVERPAHGEAARALDLIAPLAPEGSLRVSVRDLPEGGRAVLLLQDAAAPALNTGLIETLLAEGIGFDTEAGDRLTLTRAPFARPSEADLAKRYGPAGLAALMGLGALVMAAGTRRSSAPALPVRSEAGERSGVEPAHAAAPAMPRSEPRPDEDAARLAESDPDLAVRVIRTWMSEGGRA